MRWISALFFFNDTATTEIYTLSLHDALPIYAQAVVLVVVGDPDAGVAHRPGGLDLQVGVDEHVVEVHRRGDRKSTRLNSSHANISYAVFCLKKKIQIFLFPLYFSPFRPATSS